MTFVGRHIVVTRASHQASDFADLITQSGGVPVLYPCIDIAPPHDPAPLDSALRNLRAFDSVIFTSTNTVIAVQERLQHLTVNFDWRTVRIVAVGDKTDSAIENAFGRSSDFVPSHYTATTLADELAVRHSEKILLPLSAISDGELTDLLIARGTDVTTVDAYQTVIGTGGEDAPALLRENKINALTFTSGSTITNFVKRIAPETAFEMLAVCIGPSTHEVATELGFTNAHYPEKYSLENMIELLKNLLEEVQHHGNT